MKALNLRVPDDVHTALVALARENRRSLNSEIVRACEEHLREAERRAE